MKNPLPIGFGARLKELIAEGLPAKEAMKEVWREVKKSRAKTGVYSGSREIFGRKRRKNPKRKNPLTMQDRDKLRKLQDDILRLAPKKTDLDESLFEGGPSLNQLRSQIYPQFKQDLIRVLNYLKHRNPRKPKRNPIAIYNPPNQKLLYGRAYIPVIRGIKTSGKYKGERYQHNFSKSNEVSIYGNTDGSITVKSNNNLRLWDYDKDI